MDRELLKQLILDVNENIAKDTGIRRSALDIVLRYAKTDHTVVITGPRRCGKSTLLRQYIKKTGNAVYYFSFDDERLTNFLEDDFSVIHDLFLELYSERKIFLLDEVQNVRGWEKFVNRMQKNKYKFILTGSNAHLLSKEFSTFLTGRHLDVQLFPFSFEEFIRSKRMCGKSDCLDSVDKRDAVQFENVSSREKGMLKNEFSQYFTNGGFPEFVRSEEKDILKRLYEDIILKDVVLRYGIREKEALKEIAHYLISNVARPFTYTKLRDIFSIKTTPTVIDFVTYLEETYLFFTMKRFDSSLKVQNKSPKKVYAIDNGLINAIAFKQTLDEGRLLENAVFLELKRQLLEPYYFSEKNECDFIIKEGRHVHTAIQVTTAITAENREREVRGLKEAMNAFKLDEGLIITLNQEDAIVEDAKKIRIVPLWKWSLEHTTK